MPLAWRPAVCWFYETFARGNERYGKPANPEFLLRENELIEAFAPHLTVIAFEQGLNQRPHPRLVQRIAACGSEHKWANDAPITLAI